MLDEGTRRATWFGAQLAVAAAAYNRVPGLDELPAPYAVDVRRATGRPELAVRVHMSEPLVRPSAQVALVTAWTVALGWTDEHLGASMFVTGEGRRWLLEGRGEFAGAPFEVWTIVDVDPLLHGELSAAAATGVDRAGVARLLVAGVSATTPG